MIINSMMEDYATATTFTGEPSSYDAIKKMSREHSSPCNSPYSAVACDKLEKTDAPMEANEISREVLEQLLNYKFCNPEHLNRALTHRSLGDDVCNQKLEWLGDSVLQLAVSDVLYKKFHARPDIGPGELTTARISFVRGATLRSMAERWQLSRWLKTAKGVSQVFVDKMQEDMVEALLGAVMLDGGYSAARGCVLQMFSPSDWGDSMCAALDHKSELQNLIASIQVGGSPVYEVVETKGPSNNQIFVVRVAFERNFASGSGTSKMKAEQAAAKELLDQLRSKGTQPISQNAKSELLEFCHKERIQLPVFDTTPQAGKLHEVTCSDSDSCKCPVRSYFTCKLSLIHHGEVCSTTADSATKKGAEKLASDLMIKTLVSRAGGSSADGGGQFEQQFATASSHPKSVLMELSSKKQHAPPQFEILEETLPSYSVQCSYPALNIVQTAQASTKKLAEKVVAELVLQEVLRSELE